MRHHTTLQLAAIAYANYYSAPEDLAALNDYIEGTDLTIADALADDIRDLMHNRNEADLWPFCADDETLADALIGTMLEGQELMPLCYLISVLLTGTF